MRSTKEKDKKRQIFLPLSKKNPVNSCVSARVNPFKKEEPIFLKITNKKVPVDIPDSDSPLQPQKQKRCQSSIVHTLDITKRKGYIRDLKQKISQKSLQKGLLQKQKGGFEGYKNLGQTQVDNLKMASPKVRSILNFDRIENLSNLYINGDCKFTLEYNYAKDVGTDGVEMVMDHVIDNSGVGEPDESQEMIEEHYQTTI